MIILLYIIYILACTFLILVVLLQSGKGGDVAAAFGGAGSQTAFGPRGAQKPLEKATIVAAVLFMLLALVFSLPGVIGPRSVVQESNAPSATPSPAASPSVEIPAALPGASPSASLNPSPAVSPAASATPVIPEKK